MEVVTGAVRWAVEVGGGIAAPPIVDAAGTVYVGSSSGALVAVAANSGAVVWRLQLSGAVTASPALDWDGALYVAAGPTVYRLV